MSERKEKQKPDWKDYIAIVIAMLTTTLLPIIAIAIVLMIVLVILKWIF